MELTLTLKEIAILAISISIVVFFAYCTSLVKNLIITVKRTNIILEDTMQVSKIVAERSLDVDKGINKVVDMAVSAVRSAKNSKSDIEEEQNIKSTENEKKEQVL